jgi:predicted component of type VI protein secretion system
MPVLRDKLGETRSIEQIVEECEPRYKAAVVELLRREGQAHVLEESLSSE